MQAMPIKQNQTTPRVLLDFNSNSTGKGWLGRAKWDECSQGWDERPESRDEFFF